MMAFKMSKKIPLVNISKIVDLEILKLQFNMVTNTQPIKNYPVAVKNSGRFKKFTILLISLNSSIKI